MAVGRSAGGAASTIFGIAFNLYDGFTGVSARIRRSMTALENHSDGLTRSVRSNMHNLYAGMATVMSGLSMFAPIGLGIKYAAEFETAEASMITFMHSAELAKKTVETIKQDAINTPFGFSELLKVNTMLISAGKSAGDARDVTHGLAVALVAAGRGNAELSRMAINMQQIANFGAASGRDVREFSTAGINIYKLMADSMGKTTEEVKKMKPTYEMIKKALIDGAKQGGFYAGAMERYMNTVGGMLEIVKDKWKFTLAQVGDSIKSLTKVVVSAVNSILDRLYSMGQTAEGRAKLQMFALASGIMAVTLALIGLRVMLIAVRAEIYAAIAANPLIAAGFLAVGIALYSIYRHAGSLEKMFTVLKGVYEMITTFHDGAFTLSYETGTALANSGLLSYAVNLMWTFKRVEAVLSGVYASVSGMFSAIWYIIDHTISGLNWVLNKFGLIVDNTTNSLDRFRVAGYLIGAIIDVILINRLVKLIVAFGAASSASGAAAAVVGSTWFRLGHMVGRVFARVGSWAVRTAVWIKNFFGAIPNAIGKAFTWISKMFNIVNPVLKSVFSVLSRIVSKLLLIPSIIMTLIDLTNYMRPEEAAVLKANKDNSGKAYSNNNGGTNYDNLIGVGSTGKVTPIARYARPTTHAPGQDSPFNLQPSYGDRLRASGKPMNITTQVVLDGRVVGESVKQYLRDDADRNNN